MVKVVSAAASASGERTNGHKRLKVVCGANTSYLDDLAWVGDKTPLTLCDVRVSPDNAVKPNIGSLELSEALTRVLPFTAKNDNRPVLACVNFVAKEGKLKLVSADGFRLAMESVECQSCHETFTGEVAYYAVLGREWVIMPKECPTCPCAVLLSGRADWVKAHRRQCVWRILSPGKQAFVRFLEPEKP